MHHFSNEFVLFCTSLLCQQKYSQNVTVAASFLHMEQSNANPLFSGQTKLNSTNQFSSFNARGTCFPLSAELQSLVSHR